MVLPALSKPGQYLNFLQASIISDQRLEINCIISALWSKYGFLRFYVSRTQQVQGIFQGDPAQHKQTLQRSNGC